jgi:hypothetical protein
LLRAGLQYRSDFPVTQRSKESAMNAASAMQESLLERPDDVPPAPPSYTEYVERTLRDRIRAAYELGVDHGSKHRLVVLLLGLIIGWATGFSWAAMG